MIITSLLDTDLYKFTMMQVVLHHFPAANVEYRFRCRTPNVNLAPYVDEIRSEVGKLCKLHFVDSTSIPNRLVASQSHFFAVKYVGGCGHSKRAIPGCKLFLRGYGPRAMHSFS